MRKLVVAIAVMGALVGAAGCSTATGQRDQVIKALSLTKPEGRATYTVHGDPFCEVKAQLLDTQQLVDQAQAKKKLRRLVVTNASETVGVVGVAPFISECKKVVTDGMQTLK